MGRPRTDVARDTRQLILDRALDDFAEHGFAATSMRQLAKAVGVRESALYHHFPSKTAILEALLETRGPGVSLQLTQLDVGAVVEALGARGLLQLMVDTLLALWATPQEQKMFRLMLAEGPRLDEAGIVHPGHYLQRARARLAAVFEELMRRRLIRRGDPQVLTLGFLGPLAMLRLLYLVMPGQAPNLKQLKLEADAHVEHFWQSIARTPGRSAHAR
jgi:AcrR family transcriptional regulator